MAKRSLPLALALIACCAAPAAQAKGIAGVRPGDGVTVPGSPYRYLALSPNSKPRVTLVERVDRRDGRVDRWWQLRGEYEVPAVAYDGSASGLSADGSTLVLARSSLTQPYPPKLTRLAVLDVDRHLHHPNGGPRRAFRYVDLPGDFSVDAISPDGATAYLVHRFRRLAGRATYLPRFEIRALDLESGQLQRPPVVDPGGPRERMRGLPITRATSRDGRWAYTLYDANLYDDDGRAPYLQALDTVAGRVVRVGLPQLASMPRHRYYLLALRQRRGELEIWRRTPGPGAARLLLKVDERSFDVRRPVPVATSSAAFLAFTRTPRRPGNLLERTGVVGRSSGGRPIHLRQLGDPSIEGRLLIFGCIHGDECAARGLVPLRGGCPDPRANVFVVPDLNPDGRRLGTRLNGRGVDLNRNFPAAWRPIGRRGDPQYAGRRPFSEPETRLAARLVRAIRPRVTVWFHQHRAPRPLVRAWGGSVPAARRLAQLARLPFEPLPWPDGTAPNWQNHRFPGTSSFVVELPPGRLAPNLQARLLTGLDRLAREVGED